MKRNARSITILFLMALVGALTLGHWIGEVWAQEPVEAAFSADPTSGEAPLTVNFTNQSVGEIDSWDWWLGDGATSSEWNPTHVYTITGEYTAVLTVEGPGGTDVAYTNILVTQAMPEGVDTFAQIDGVWVCSWKCAKALAMVLRSGLIEVGKSKLASQGQAEKMELVYNYLSSPEFQQRVDGVVEAFIGMQADLESERRSMKRIWSKREKQIDRALSNTAGLYGDLQGIIGASLPWSPIAITCS